MSRHEVTLTDQIRVISGHANDCNVEQHPHGTALTGPLYAMLFVGDAASEATEYVDCLASPDDVLDWLEDRLDEHNLMPETEEIWEEWMRKVCVPLLMEGKDGFNIQLFAAALGSNS